MNIYKLRAFPKEPHGGNKAGVVLDTKGLTEQDMLQIASDVGYSETAFVFPSEKADFKVRFFTPNTEVDLCGHATIATFNLLRDKNIIQVGIYTQETKAGILTLHVKKDMVYMQQNNPIFHQELNKTAIKGCFNIKDIHDEQLPIMIVSTGMKEIFLPIKSVEVLHALRPNIERIKEVSKTFDVIGIHAFALDQEVDAYGRNFAPLVGIDEESATGTSNGALGCYLATYHNPEKETFILRQGYSMNQPSEIITTLTKQGKSISEVLVGGNAILFDE